MRNLRRRPAPYAQQVGPGQEPVALGLGVRCVRAPSQQGQRARSLWKGRPVTRPAFELSPEALGLIEQVSGLEERLADIQQALAEDLANVRAEARSEVARVERATGE